MFIQTMEPELEKYAVPQKSWDELRWMLRFLRDYKHQVELEEFRAPSLRDSSRKTIELCDTLQQGDTLPPEVVSQVVHSAREVERTTCLCALRQAEAEAIAMDHQVRAFRDYVMEGARPKEPRAVVPFWDLVSQAMDNLREFAHSKGVDFRPRNEAWGVRVEVSERDVLRALANILHNAVKYSWSRERGQLPWVTIRAYAQETRVAVELENWGVPIPKDELEMDLIFQIGYRGRLSSDRGRLGTGIGLTDARNTARAHGGDVTVRSRPARRDESFDTTTAPYITTVTLWLPVHP